MRVGLSGVLVAVMLAGCAAEAPAPHMLMANGELNLAGKRAAGLYKPTNEADMKAMVADKSFAGTPLDLSGFRVTFEDDFNTMSVTDGNGVGPWYSPVHADFGASKFLPPREGKGPVLVRDGKLVIQLYQEDGRWVSSNVQSVNKAGEGFAQQYGYFEVRAKFPPQMGSWSAFWLHSHPALTGPGVPQTEIDVIEAYGGDPKGHHANVHIWGVKGKNAVPLEGDVKKHAGKGSYTKVEDMFDDFHTYGVLITPQHMVFYFDRKELVRMPTKPEFETPQYILLDLALLGKQAHLAKGLMEMEVDYVRVWQGDFGK